MKKCPFCAEEIQQEAIKCKHCGEFLNKKDIVQKSKDAVKSGVEFIQDKNKQRLEKKYRHLQVPTNDNPMEIGAFKFFGDYVMYEGLKFYYKNTLLLFFEHHKEGMNGVKTKEVVDLKLKIHSDETNSEGDTTILDIDLSKQPFFIGRSKTTEKILFLKDYLRNKTFDSRLDQYIEHLKEHNYVPFFCSEYGIKANGDIISLEDEKYVLNLFEKLDKKLVEYQNTNWSGLQSNFYDPYSMIIYKNSKPKIKLLGFDLSNKITIRMSGNQDINDYILDKIIRKVPVE